MAVITKFDVSLDVTQPAQEVADVITLLLGMYPGREIEILQQIDEEVGSALAKLEKAKLEAESTGAETSNSEASPEL
ncbi:hypothetical protein [Paenibacillus brevis]|uniref:Uncharacterized protein n=1 Tax=Paenibacillus brevis TaxID=2841508 RepID=A0ABS6FVT8_9BACL|nr:hypothetical protein [Paenibacillus brevis]MBU5673261.1 hypothetical protein [Paenibacillus brevis]